MKRTTMWALLLVPALAVAGELKGVTMADTQEVAGKQLKLNGMGLRKKLIFDVYVAGLYLETPTKDASAAVSTDQVRRVHMRMLRDLGKDTVGESIEKGFKANNAAQMPKLEARLKQLLAGLSDLKKGEDIVITYVPGEGTRLEIRGQRAEVIPGKDFADAMFSVWLGSEPVDGSLKEGMLGQKR